MNKSREVGVRGEGYHLGVQVLELLQLVLERVVSFKLRLLLPTLQCPLLHLSDKELPFLLLDLRRWLLGLEHVGEQGEEGRGRLEVRLNTVTGVRIGRYGSRSRANLVFKFS